MRREGNEIGEELDLSVFEPVFNRTTAANFDLMEKLKPKDYLRPCIKGGRGHWLILPTGKDVQWE